MTKRITEPLSARIDKGVLDTFKARIEHKKKRLLVPTSHSLSAELELLIIADNRKHGEMR